MGLIKLLLQHSRMMFVLSVVAGILSGLASAALLAILNHALRQGDPLTPGLVGSFIGLCLLLPLFRFLAEFLLNKLGQNALYSIRMELSRQIVAAPLRHLEQLGTHRLLASLTEDVQIIINTVMLVPLLCINGTVIFGCLIYMSSISGYLLAVVLACMVLGIAGYYIPAQKAQRIFKEARDQSDSLQQHFRALTLGTKELKINNNRRKAFFTDALNVTADAARRKNMAAMQIHIAAASWGQAFVFAVIGLIVFISPGILHISGTALTGYALSLLYLTSPLQVIMNMLPNVARANVAVNKVKDLGFELSGQEAEECSEPCLPCANWRTLEFKAVAHRYSCEGEASAFQVGPVTLTFKAGEVVFITGGNGSGKTTFAKLLTGLYAPEAGEILLDGRPIGSRERDHYRQYFAVVFSDFYLFEQLLGLSGANCERDAQEYLIRLNLAHKVHIGNGRWSTIELSQGQRKRLALLTAYLEDRLIYLFDEWAADQDPVFKDVFYTQLLAELKAKNKTVFVISHDDRYYHVADRIIKLDEGQVVSDTSALEKSALVEAVTARRVSG
jgi:putative pyoverdin transport system ATP-binding/permease protein